LLLVFIPELGPSAVFGNVVVMHHVDKENPSLLDAEDDPVAAGNPGFQIVLVRVNRLDSQARGLELFNERDGSLIASRLTIGAELGVTLLPGLRP
jgi:hypothetical protein